MTESTTYQRVDSLTADNKRLHEEVERLSESLAHVLELGFKAVRKASCVASRVCASDSLTLPPGPPNSPLVTLQRHWHKSPLKQRLHPALPQHADVALLRLAGSSSEVNCSAQQRSIVHQRQHRVGCAETRRWWPHATALQQATMMQPSSMRCKQATRHCAMRTRVYGTRSTQLQSWMQSWHSR